MNLITILCPLGVVPEQTRTMAKKGEHGRDARKAQSLTARKTDRNEDNAKR